MRRFLFKLAAHLGRTIQELEQSISYAEFIEWMAYDRLDPIGGYRQDLQTAHILSVLIGSKGKTISDYLPIDPNPMTDDQRQAYEKARKKAKLDAQMSMLIRHLSKSCGE